MRSHTDAKRKRNQRGSKPSEAIRSVSGSLAAVVALLAGWMLLDYAKAVLPLVPPNARAYVAVAGMAIAVMMVATFLRVKASTGVSFLGNSVQMITGLAQRRDQGGEIANAGTSDPGMNETDPTTTE
jgi:hypothetical protein